MLTKDEILRKKILEGADKLFQKYGFNKTTMEDIAKEAGKGKSTLYYYFKNKEEIFDEIVQQEKTLFFNIIQEEISKAPSATDKLTVFVTTRFHRIRQLTNLYQIMVEEMAEALKENRSSCTAPYRKQYDEKEANIVKSIFQYGIVTGEFKLLNESELDMMTFVFLSTQNGLEHNLIMYNRLDEMLSRLSFFLDIIFEGIKKK